jgi:uncharacterized OB-fold protein
VGEQVQAFAPAVPFLKIDPEGRHWLAGARCARCGAVIAGDRTACPSCGARNALEPVRLGDRGVLHTYTIVHRSMPGVKTPFVAAVVDLEGGGTLKGTMVDVDPEPAKLVRDMPVRVVIRDTGQRDREGKAFLCYFFTPAEGAAS